MIFLGQRVRISKHGVGVQGHANDLGARDKRPFAPGQRVIIPGVTATAAIYLLEVHRNSSSPIVPWVSPSAAASDHSDHSLRTATEY